MLKFSWKLCLALLLLGSAVSGSQSCAKPPDLPVDLGVDFDEAENKQSFTVGYDPFTGKWSLSVSMPWALLQSWLPESLGFAVPAAPEANSRTNGACPPREAPVATVQEVPPQLCQARTMFAIAERCLKNGDLDKARTCYEEAHLLAPQTRLGRQAIQRLADIDSARTATQQDAEEQEPRQP